MDEFAVQQLLDARDTRLRQEWKNDINHALETQAQRFDAMLRNVELALSAALSLSETVSDKIDRLDQRDEERYAALVAQFAKQDKLLLEWRADIERWRHVQRVGAGAFQLLMVFPWLALVRRFFTWLKLLLSWVLVVGSGIALGVVLFVSAMWR